METWSRPLWTCGKCVQELRCLEQSGIWVIKQIIPRFPFSVKIGFRFSVTLLDKTRVNRALEASQKASKTRNFQGPHFGIILDDRRLDLPGKTRVFLHAHA